MVTPSRQRKSHTKKNTRDSDSPSRSQNLNPNPSNYCTVSSLTSKRMVLHRLISCQLSRDPGSTPLLLRLKHTIIQGLREHADRSHGCAKKKNTLEIELIHNFTSEAENAIQKEEQDPDEPVATHAPPAAPPRPARGDPCASRW